MWDTSVGSGSWELKLGAAQILAGAIIALFTIVNCLGIRRTARVQNVLTSLKILIILAFLIAGFAFGQGSWENFTHPAVRTSVTPLFAQFFVSLFYIYVSYSGWNAATYVAEELKHPARTLPLSLAYGTALVAALFIGLNVLFIYAVPLESMKGVVAVGALAAQHLFGPAVAGIFSAAMALSLLATVNAEVTIGPRVYYAMAKNGAFFSMAAKVDPRWHTPVIAILCQGVVRHSHDRSPVSQFAALHRTAAQLFRRALGGFALHFPPAAGLAEAGRRQFRLSAGARVFRGGGRVDDRSWRDASPGNFSHRSADGSGRRGGVPFQATKIDGRSLWLAARHQLLSRDRRESVFRLRKATA